MNKKERKHVSRVRKEEDKKKRAMSENDRRAADKLEIVYKLYFSKVATARVEEDEAALRLALMELGAATTEWLDIMVKDIEDAMQTANSKELIDGLVEEAKE